MSETKLEANETSEAPPSLLQRASTLTSLPRNKRERDHSQRQVALDASLNHHHQGALVGSSFASTVSNLFRHSHSEISQHKLHEAIIGMIDERQFNALLQCDQLRLAISKEMSFVGFSEADIQFKPTFKVLRTDKVEYDAQRLPAYCDRVLWRSSPCLPVICRQYSCGEEACSSDHKPVAAFLELAQLPGRPSWWPLRWEKHSYCQKRRSSLLDSILLADGGVPQHGVHKQVPAHVLSYRFQLLSLKASKLSAHNTPTSPTSNPFCVFQGAAVLKPVCTPVVHGNRNPTWPTASLPSFSVVTLDDGNARSLFCERVLVTIVDFDHASHHTAMARGVLHAKDFLDDTGVPRRGKQNFCLPLLLRGLPAGSLEGSLIVKQERNVPTGVLLREKARETARLRSMHTSIKEKIFCCC